MRAGSSSEHSALSSARTAIGPTTRLWTYDKVEPTLIRYDKLRYRLMPYIYSLAWKVTSEDYTIQRPLVMDWRTDEKTWNIGDEFMFGPAILVNPVLKANATHRSVYLPPVARSGTTSGPERRSQAARRSRPMRRWIACRSMCAPDPFFRWDRRSSMPRRIPVAPLNFASIAEPTAQFDLYDDAGDSYDYEKGQHSVIPIRWNDSAGAPDDRRTQRFLPGNGREAHIPDRGG